jgi:transposase, IS30 family
MCQTNDVSVGEFSQPRPGPPHPASLEGRECALARAGREDGVLKEHAAARRLSRAGAARRIGQPGRRAKGRIPPVDARRSWLVLIDWRFDGQVAGSSRVLGRHRSTVGREIRRCGGRRGQYRPLKAERVAERLAGRPKPTKLSVCPALVAAVERGLGDRWSPQQISARLKAEFPDDLGMRISHETIYLSLYVQSRGELRRQLSANLRSGRTKRRPVGRIQRHGRIAGMIPISQRPASVEDRAVPGHWEGDLIMGANCRSAVATLVERQTRYVMLAWLGNDHSTLTVIEALKERMQTLPAHLVRSLTWDQGTELTAHHAFTVATGVSVYFCDPHSP